MAVERYKMLNRSRALLKAQQVVAWLLSKSAIGLISDKGRFSFRASPEISAGSGLSELGRKLHTWP